MAGLTDSLRQRHDVLVYQVDDEEQPTQVASFPRNAVSVPVAGPSPATATPSWDWSQTLMTTSSAFAILSFVIWMGFVLLRATRRDPQRYAALLATWCMLAALIILAVCHIRDPKAVDRWLRKEPRDDLPTTTPSVADALNDASTLETPVDWQQSLAARGTATRLGDALTYVIQKERGGPLAGITVMTDGNENQGKPLNEAAELARHAGVPVFPLGVGSPRQPANVRVSEVDAPSRVFPGDDFRLRVFLQATGLAGQSVLVQLREIGVGDESGTLIEEDRARLGANDETSVVEFRLAPTQIGRKNYVAEVLPSGSDSDPQDNQRRVAVTVVDRQNRILLFAGGPVRDYQFLRVQCYRDPEIRVDVLLQGAPAGLSQEADQVLTDLPGTLAELAEYDCIFAFDPDWNQLTEAQVGAVDRWLAEQAGGLIVAAGTVYTPEWTTAIREPRQLRTVKTWYPVSFFRRGARLGATGWRPRRRHRCGSPRRVWRLAACSLPTTSKPVRTVGSRLMECMAVTPCRV